MTGSKRLMLALSCALIACASAVLLGTPASGQDLQERLSETQEKLSESVPQRVRALKARALNHA